ncbi:MAG: SDR family oxidoreductase [Euryarchaeota archaeon]|nr:SDR family oxidoreductase [Euryarchaeota archaeon]
MDLRDKVCVVTGASRGIGKAVAEAFAARGAHLFLVARNERDLQATADACSTAGAPEVVVHAADLATTAGVRSTTKTVTEVFGGYDVLVNNAGRGEAKPITEVSDAEFDIDMALNLRAPYLLTRHAVEVMRRRGGGQVVQIASGLAYGGRAEWSLYAAAKFGLRGFTESVRQEVSQENIKVGTVAPGYTATHFFDSWGVPDAFALPLAPEDVAHAVVAMVEQPETSDMKEITVRNRASP